MQIDHDACRRSVNDSMTQRAGAPAAFGRLVAACNAINPQTRARLLAAFLATNLFVLLLSATHPERLGWVGSAGWIYWLEFDDENSVANSYTVVLWAAIAVLALAQLACSTERRRSRALGWASLALIAALIALEEAVCLKTRIEQPAAGFDLAAIPGLDFVPAQARWLVVVVPLLAVPLAAAGWVLVTSQRGHPMRALFAVVAAILLLGAIALDPIEFPGVPPAWQRLFEEGSEVMAAATLAVVLLEMRAEQPATVSRSLGSRLGPRRRAAALALAMALLGALGFLLSTPHIYYEDIRAERDRPWSYSGPVSLVEQRFRANHDHLTRIHVWAYVDGADGAAEIFARLHPVDGSDSPIRESRAEVTGVRFSDSIVEFQFEPIVDSGGELFSLTVGVLSGPTPYVFLGLTGVGALHEGAAIVSGVPTRHNDALAMRTFRVGRLAEELLFGDSLTWLLIGEAIRNIFLWVFLVTAAWPGISGRRPRFWRNFAGPAAFTSALITAGIFVATLAFIVVGSSTRLV